MKSLRALIQRDAASRGLASVPGDNLFTDWTDDLTYAARSLAWHPRPHLVIVTGFPIVRPEGIFGETDGPLGALFLARALRPLGMAVTIAAEPFWKTDLCLNPLPALPDTTTHLLSIERVGPSWHDGRCYSMRGRDVTPWVAPVAGWFEQAQPRRIVTLGIGDGGNELGMGKLRRDVIACNIAHGETIACRVPVDHLIVADVSNWGAYALAAAVYRLRGRKPTNVFAPEREATELRRLVEREGLIDGKTGQAEATVDGLDLGVYLAMLVRIEQWLAPSGER